MVIRAWSEEFCSDAPVAAETARHVRLHVADVAVAFFAGCRAPEARALASFYAGASGGNTDGQAAAVAAMVRRTECDDIHVASCVTPGSVVVPVALAFAARDGSDPQRFERAVASGYAVGLRIGAALGGAEALGTGIWPTYFAAPLMAAAAASVALGLDAERIASAISLAAAGAGGRAGRISGHPSGRWLALGEAVGKGCRAALAAAEGFRGDPGLISADWLAAIADPKFIRPEAMVGGDGIEAVGFKPFVAARQTINAVEAFHAILDHNIEPRAIERIEVRVPPVHAGMVAKPAMADDRLSVIASMHVQIAAAALRPDLLYDIERLGEPASDLMDFARRIVITADASLDAYLPNAWAAGIKVVADGQQLEELCVSVAGDRDRDDAEVVIRNKLARMVPQNHHQVCEAMLDDRDAAQSVKIAALWREMLAAMA